METHGHHGRGRPWQAMAIISNSELPAAAKTKSFSFCSLYASRWSDPIDPIEKTGVTASQLLGRNPSPRVTWDQVKI